MTKLKIREQSLNIQLLKRQKLISRYEELEMEINKLQHLNESNNIEDKDNKDTLSTQKT